MRRTLYDDDHDQFRASFRAFVEQEIVPHHLAWEAAGVVDRDLYRRAGSHGFLGLAVPEELGGGGVDDFRFHAVMAEEVQRANVAGSGLGMSLHNDICLPYLLSLATDEQRRRWLPGACSGDLVLAIAMTEPGTGSDVAAIATSAIRDGDDFVVNGSKTFISSGFTADLFITAVKTDPSQRHGGLSLLAIPGDAAGVTRGRNLDKIGLHAQDTAELFFTDVRVPAANLLGTEGGGFKHLVHHLPQERMSMAVEGVAAAEAAFGWTLEHVQQRTAFGQPIGRFQNTRFQMAEMRTQIDVAQAFVDRCIVDLADGELSAEDAAKAKWWATELQKDVVDRCLQLFGGYGYMLEYPIARAYVDARVATIYGGTTEIMKELIGRSLGL